MAEPTITPDQRPAQKINPIGSFRAKSECNKGTDCDAITFDWSLMCILPGLPQPIDYLDDNNYENITLSDDPEIQPIESLRVTSNLRKMSFVTKKLVKKICHNSESNPQPLSFRHDDLNTALI